MIEIRRGGLYSNGQPGYKYKEKLVIHRDTTNDIITTVESYYYSANCDDKYTEMQKVRHESQRSLLSWITDLVETTRFKYNNMYDVDDDIRNRAYKYLRRFGIEREPRSDVLFKDEETAAAVKELQERLSRTISDVMRMIDEELPGDEFEERKKQRKARNRKKILQQFQHEFDRLNVKVIREFRDEDLKSLRYILVPRKPSQNPSKKTN